MHFIAIEAQPLFCKMFNSVHGDGLSRIPFDQEAIKYIVICIFTVYLIFASLNDDRITIEFTSGTSVLLFGNAWQSPYPYQKYLYQNNELMNEIIFGKIRFSKF
jgi:hypothetical protein